MKDKLLDSRLVLENVSHSYGAVSVLKDLNLVVNSGEVVVLVGPSGCGKTTILNLLSGHIEAVSGSIHREGIIRTVYQHDGLFPWLTVSENITIGLRSMMDAAKREKEMRELVELIHLKGFEHHYPHQLSGGMRQRVELARVLAGDSDILLMDEPFSALDYQTRLRGSILKNQGSIKTNQKTIVDNQKSLKGNQGTIIANQKAIINNQKVILKNQKTLDQILKNQQTILKLLKKK